MSKEKAKEFIKYLIDNPEVTEKMKGFTQEDLKDAAEELKGEGKVPDIIESHFPA